MKTFKQHLSEDNVATLKKIVSNKQNMPLKMKDGSMKVDLFTASAFVKGMEKINPTNKKKVMDMINNGTKAQFLQLQNVFMKADDEDPADDDSQKLQAMDQEKLDEILEMSEETFYKHLDELSDEDLLQLESVLGALGRGVKAVGKAAVGGVKKVANRLSTAGRADAAQAKLAKMQKRKADRDRLAKAKADMAAMKAREREQKAAKRDAEDKKAEQERERARQERERNAKANEEVELEEGKMKELHGYISQGKSAEEIAKLMKLDVKTIKALMNSKESNMKNESIYDASLKVLLGEDGYSQNPAMDGTDSALHDISKDDVVKQLNAFVQSIAMREYVNPKGALLQLQGKLATIGLSFDVPEMPGEKGKVVAELTQYGGRYGKDTDTNYDEVINDDGIAHRGIERKLEIEYETVRHGCTKVYAKIV
tara:strand:- start:5164 stop:6438 length:1275 start_codon:yes stop_codon:yes gene_type:complete